MRRRSNPRGSLLHALYWYRPEDTSKAGSQLCGQSDRYVHLPDCGVCHDFLSHLRTGAGKHIENIRRDYVEVVSGLHVIAEGRTAGFVGQLSKFQNGHRS